LRKFHQYTSIIVDLRKFYCLAMCWVCWENCSVGNRRKVECK